MNTQWRFFIPTLLATILVLLSTFSQFYYIFIFLLVGNVFNWIWGEFSQKELAATLTYFYRTQNALIVKSINAILLLFFIVWGIYYVDSTSITVLRLMGFSLTVGLFTGCFVVTLGHDLIHSKSKLLKFLSILLFTASGIPHFATEHLCGHHREIGLKQDPSTAKLNQNFYNFFVKVVYKNFKHNYITPYRFPNYFRKKIITINFSMLAILLLIWLIIFLVSSKPQQTLAFFILQGAFSYFLYEMINYIQHYGLTRNTENERIGVHLSWNSYYKYTNYILFLLPLHSLHHLPKSKKKIIDLKSGPRMPYLYFVMILLAMVPTLWFHKMNHLIPNKSAI